MISILNILVRWQPCKLLTILILLSNAPTLKAHCFRVICPGCGEVDIFKYIKLWRYFKIHLCKLNPYHLNDMKMFEALWRNKSWNYVGIEVIFPDLVCVMLVNRREGGFFFRFGQSGFQLAWTFCSHDIDLGLFSLTRWRMKLSSRWKAVSHYC